MFNILTHKGNANQNANTKIACHPSQNGYHQENKQQMLVRMQKKELSYTIGRNSVCCNLYGNQYGSY
jgi:hypothetical protein